MNTKNPLHVSNGPRLENKDIEKIIEWAGYASFGQG
jgi:hypothetical protein